MAPLSRWLDALAISTACAAQLSTPSREDRPWRQSPRRHWPSHECRCPAFPRCRRCRFCHSWWPANAGGHRQCERPHSLAALRNSIQGPIGNLFHAHSKILNLLILNDLECGQQRCSVGFRLFALGFWLRHRGLIRVYPRKSAVEWLPSSFSSYTYCHVAKARAYQDHQPGRWNAEGGRSSLAHAA